MATIKLKNKVVEINRISTNIIGIDNTSYTEKGKALSDLKINNKLILESYTSSTVIGINEKDNTFETLYNKYSFKVL